MTESAGNFIRVIEEQRERLKQKYCNDIKRQGLLEESKKYNDRELIELCEAETDDEMYRFLALLYLKSFVNSVGSSHNLDTIFQLIYFMYSWLPENLCKDLIDSCVHTVEYFVMKSTSLTEVLKFHGFLSKIKKQLYINTKHSDDQCEFQVKRLLKNEIISLKSNSPYSDFNNTCEILLNLEQNFTINKEILLIATLWKNRIEISLYVCDPNDLIISNLPKYFNTFERIMACIADDKIFFFSGFINRIRNELNSKLKDCPKPVRNTKDLLNNFNKEAQLASEASNPIRKSSQSCAFLNPKIEQSKLYCPSVDHSKQNRSKTPMKNEISGDQPVSKLNFNTLLKKRGPQNK